MEFKDWFAQKVKVGAYPNPRELAPNGRLSDADVFINVSDEAYEMHVTRAMTYGGKQAYWFPLGEAWGMCLSSIYGALNIMWQAEKAGLSIYLHCHAGVNRSQTVADCYHFMRSGEHRPLQFGLLGDNPDTRNQLQCNIGNNVLPDTFTMEGWLKQMNYAVTRPMGGWMDASREQAGIPCPFGVVAA